MNKVNKGLIVIIVLLTILLLSLGGYIIYDKVLREDNNVNDLDDNMDDIVLLNENEALEIARDITEKYFKYYHDLGPYCGERDNEDYISFGSYETQDFRDYNASLKYKSINEIKEYYESFMVEGLLPKYLDNGVSYIEQDGKLYCQLSHKGCGDIYNENESSYTINNIEEDTISVNVILASNTCGDYLNKREGKIVIVKDNLGVWKIKEYDVMIVG